MANISVTCQNFPGPVPANGTNLRDISYRAVLRACIILGLQRFSDVWALGWRDLTRRMGIGLSSVAFLVQSPQGLITSHQFNHDLDMSEKGAMSYWYGMIMAKLTAESELQVPWLAHVDQMRRAGVLITNPNSNSRGDLVGRGMNGWHVFEAKGRSNPYAANLVTDAKQQAAMVTSVHNQPPVTSSACITALFTTPISVLLDDPPPDDERQVSWDINESAFFRQYYQGIIDYVRELGPRRREIGNNSVVTAPLFPFVMRQSTMRRFYPFDPRLELGLLSSIYERPEQAAQIVGDLQADERGYLSSDGIALVGRLPDWEEESEREVR